MAKLRAIASMRDTLILAQKAEAAEAPPALPLAAPPPLEPGGRKARAKTAAE